jgi:tetratricopeptide (TPR) repeat protein
MSSPTPTFPFPPAVQAQADEAERLAQAGHGEAATRLYQRVLQLAPGHARALSFLAMRAFADGQLAEARRLIEAASAGHPKLALVEANRALILRELGEPEAALEALQAALAHDPGFVPARFAAGELLRGLGRPREAAEQFELGLARLPTGATLPA